MKGENSMPNGPDVFCIPEDVIKQRLGVARSWIRDHRGPEGQFWKRAAAGVMWTQAGVDALVAMVAQTPAGENPLPPDEVEVLVVWRTRMPNRRIVLAHRENDAVDAVTTASAQTVWVGTSDRFVPGMRLLARLRSGQYWDFAGNPENPAAGRRLPRSVGRW